jgi:hypothetical protein
MQQLDKKDFSNLKDIGAKAREILMAAKMPDILISPWLDVSMINPEIKLASHKDIFVRFDAFRRAGIAYARTSIIPLYPRCMDR